MIIAVDFDGTCVKHEYPEVGETLPGAIETLKEIAMNGHHIIIYTMRDGQELEDAKLWYEYNDIPFWKANENPTQSKWTNSPKVYAQLYIDDVALGIPLKQDSPNTRPYVDWAMVRVQLKKLGVI